MADFVSYKNKLKDFGLQTGEFKDADGKIVNYSQLAIKVQLEGDVETIVLSGNSAPKPALLRSILKGADAKTPAQDAFLDD